MNSQRTGKFVFALIAVVVAALWIGVSAGTSEAQGPAGRGQNGAGRAQGYNAQSQAQVQDPALNAAPAGQQNQFGPNGRGTPGQQQSRNLALQIPPVPGDVPAQVVQAMSEGWLDEVHAYQTYESIMLQFGRVAPFVNIQAAEAQHRAALEAMFARYNLPLPTPSEAVQASEFASFADACAAAVEAEIANGALYDQWLAAVQDYPDLTQVFTSLRDASLNHHLPAFERCAGR